MVQLKELGGPPNEAHLERAGAAVEHLSRLANRMQRQRMRRWTQAPRGKLGFAFSGLACCLDPLFAGFAILRLMLVLLLPKLAWLLAPSPDVTGVPAMQGDVLIDCLMYRWTLGALRVLPLYGFAPTALGMLELLSVANAAMFYAGETGSADELLGEASSSPPSPSEASPLGSGDLQVVVHPRWAESMRAVRFLFSPAFLLCETTAVIGKPLAAVWRTPHPAPATGVPIRVHFDTSTFGGGIQDHAMFEMWLEKHHKGRTFKRAIEWCSGAAFVGFSLLAAGKADTLCLIDINPEAIAQVKRTAEENGLSDRVTAYVSDGIDGLPAEERFDLVVGQPPWAVGKQMGMLINDDASWACHRNFYSGIRAHLSGADAVVVHSAMQPTQCTAHFFEVDVDPYDVRGEVPCKTFADMAKAGGLEQIGVEQNEVIPYFHLVSSTPTP